jgi:opacity protein-like surface antigen
MKKLTFIILATLLVCGLVHPVDLFVNGFFGSRTLNNSSIKDIYGSGPTFLFGAGATFKGAFAEIGYASFSRDGESSFYNEKTEFSLKGFNLRLGYEYGIHERFFPKAYIGIASFNVKEEVNSQFVPETDVSKTGFLLGIGLRVDLYQGLSLEGRIENIGLKVKPHEDEVNLGGWRLLIGASFYLNLNSE